MSDNDWTAQFPFQNFPDGKYVHLYIEKRTMILTNRMIAERLGWTDVSEDKARVAFVDSVVLTGIPPQPGRDIQVPDYLRSTDAALTLPLAEGDVIELQVLWDGTTAARIVRSITGAMGEWHDADSAAQAVCAAWWAWMEAQEG